MPGSDDAKDDDDDDAYDFSESAADVEVGVLRAAECKAMCDQHKSDTGVPCGGWRLQSDVCSLHAPPLDLLLLSSDDSGGGAAESCRQQMLAPTFTNPMVAETEVTGMGGRCVRSSDFPGNVSGGTPSWFTDCGASSIHPSIHPSISVSAH